MKTTFLGLLLVMLFAVGQCVAQPQPAAPGQRDSLIAAAREIMGMAFLSIALLTTALSRRKARAFGLALFLWFFFVLFYDLIALAGSLLLSGRSATLFLFWSLFGNPVDMVRVASLITLDNATAFGVAGAALLRFLGGPAAGLAVLVCGTAVWIVWPIFVSHALIKKQDIK